MKHDDYFISFNLTAGYHHVSMLPEHRKFLGFSYYIKGVKKYCVFCQMPFGLSTACYLFTKLIRPLVKLWRSEGVRSFVYIDDGVMACNNLQEAGIISNRIKSDLQNAGFLINHSKSNWVPTKHLSWLGFEFDSSSMTLKVNERKVEKFLDQCRRILQASSVSPRQVAVAVGQQLTIILHRVSNRLVQHGANRECGKRYCGPTPHAHHIARSVSNFLCYRLDKSAKISGLFCWDVYIIFFLLLQKLNPYFQNGGQKTKMVAKKRKTNTTGLIIDLQSRVICQNVH